MLTKDDKKWVRENTASKADLKKELANYATKADLKDEISGSRIYFRNEMAQMEQRIEGKAASRHNELMDLFDGLAKEVKDNEEFRLTVNHRLDIIQGLSD